MTTPRRENTKGVLYPKAGASKFLLSHHDPADDLSTFVMRYWIVSWNLDEQETHTQETLPYPCVNLVIEHGRSGIFGIVRRKFSRRLEGRGRAFGIKFRPGAFYPFLQSSVARLTNHSIPVREVFDVEDRDLEADVLGLETEAEMVERVEQFLRAYLPEPDENVERVGQVVDRIEAEPAITKVDDVVDRSGVSKRTLQRLFRRYVGVGPKWVIQRYRLQEAADRLADGASVDWPKLALDLGYFDQAHFINEFRDIVGQSPAEYARSVRSGA